MADRRSKLAFAVLCLATAVPVIVPTALAGDSHETVDVLAGKPFEFSFTLSTQHVLTGMVTFVIHNVGHLPHDFSMRGHTSTTVAPGATGSFTLRIPEPGVYEYISAIPGQRAAGMTGELTVLPRHPGPRS
jgi:plastocyanin